MKHLLTVLCTLPLLAQSIDKSRLLGQHMATEIRRQTRPVDDPALTAYATNLLLWLKANTSVELVHADSSRSTALPGGPLFLPVSLLLQANSEAELATTIAHALGHAAAPFMISSDRGPTIVILDPHANVPPTFRPRLAEAEAAADRFAAALVSQATLDREAFRTAQAAARALLPPKPAPTLRRL
jgi:hypothetical protein